MPETFTERARTLAVTVPDRSGGGACAGRHGGTRDRRRHHEEDLHRPPQSRTRFGTMRAAHDPSPSGVEERPDAQRLAHPHGKNKQELRVPGVNSNALTDEEAVDPLSGNAVLNGIPVEVRPLAEA